jgi:hypothetical protein
MPVSSAERAFDERVFVTVKVCEDTVCIFEVAMPENRPPEELRD